ncbi:MAG: type I pullulanase [Ectobacillus sp.]
MHNKGKRWFSILAVLAMAFSLFSNVSMQAFAESTVKLIIHYQAAPDNQKDWNIWAWPEGGEGKAYPFTGEDAFGKYAEIELPGDYKRAGFIVRTDSWEKDGGDRWIEIENGEGEVWVKAGDENTYTSPPDGEYRSLPSYEKVNLTIHYSRYDNNYDGWNLWVWPDGKEGQAVAFTGEDEFGKVAKVELSSSEGIQKAGFIVRQSKDGNDWANKEFGDRYITKFKEDGSAEVWIAQGVERVFYDPSGIDRSPKIIRAAIDKMNEITLETNFPFSTTDSANAGITLDGAKIKEVLPYKDGENPTNKVRIITEENLDLTKSYTITKEVFGSAAVEMGKVVRSDEFDKLFYYEGNDLGNIYSKKETSFRLWAPTASEAKLVTYKKWDDANGTEVAMAREEKGTWTAVLPGDQDGLIYTYKVKIGSKWNEAVDPYVRAVTVNGDKGVVVNLKSTDPKKWSMARTRVKNPEDAIIYETHIRDLSIDPNSGIKHKGKFLGVAEQGTTGPNRVKTGLNHIKDLGVTHVQFIPMYDYRTVDETKLDQPQYNWGYDPENYNAPEGSYSTNPYEPKVRINEMKQMIQTLHDNDLNVVMDVVYNHMYSANESNFNQLVPGYYFRYNEDGTLANGTGVGNDTASERKMMRKFIVDSVTYWATEYHIDGFRFDLMGIHDVETMNEVRKALDAIDPRIIIIGEGWDLGTPLPADQKANQKNAEKMDGVAHFNDVMRDGLKGSVFFEDDKGFVNGKQGVEDVMEKSIAAGMDYGRGTATYTDPEQVVTYVEAHDNHTLWDKLLLTNPDATEEERKQMHKLASSIVLTSQGISFIHAGQEFMRTKGGNHNSYNAPDDVNKLDWQRRAAFSKEVEYMKGLIELRKQHPAFRLTTEEDIRKHLTFMEAPQNVVAYTLDKHANQDRAKQLVVIHNANKEAVEIDLPKKGKWNLLVNGKKAGSRTIQTVQGDSVTVPALSSFVLEKR